MPCRAAREDRPGPAGLRDLRAAAAGRERAARRAARRPRRARPGLRRRPRARARRRPARRAATTASAGAPSAQIDEGRSWAWIEDGVVLFKAEASAWTPSAVQLQQVWVDPAARGQGHASRGLRDLIRLLLEGTPTVTLFVRRENEPAIRLYESIGMRHVLDYRSVLFCAGGLCRERRNTVRSGWTSRGRRARRGAHPPARADRARRRGALPRLGRRRLDLPPPRAARARLPGLGAARRPRAPRRRVRRGRRLLRA